MPQNTHCMVVGYLGELGRSAANQKRASEAGIALVSEEQLEDLQGAISRIWLQPRNRKQPTA